ncbi:TPA: divisome-associated lipoprotein YraP [Klebsiella oxytoca]|uniref:Divisome-associated lipoprotein YraP n=1 Tax=Klebsiella oxytoca TaxID=571 RepID=A0AAN5RDH3_KLEOX|nr:divisome-associated lipoprotein YraP [Klebsiella oxytoca]
MRNYLLPLTIFLCLPLQGCVATALISSAALAAKTTVDPRSTGEQIDDTTLLLRTQHVLENDPALRQHARVVATVWQDQILLTGEAPTTSLREKALQLVRRVPGVRTVWNEIRPGHPISSGQIALDIWLASQVRTRVLFSDQARLSDIKVITENNEVFLLGRVTAEEGRRVATLTSRINGVHHVTTAWTLIR